MTRNCSFMLLAAVLLAGCGDAVTGMDEDAKAAKSQAHAAVQAAQDAAARVDELGRAAMDQANGKPDNAADGSH